MNIDTNINNYTSDELLEILQLDEPNKNDVEEITNNLIFKYENDDNDELSNFFKLVKEKLLNELFLENEEISDEFNEDNLIQDSDETSSIFDSELITTNIPDLYNTQIKEPEKTFTLENTKGILNPNLQNKTTRLVNIDSKFRQNIFPILENFNEFEFKRFNEIINPHTSIYSTTDYTVDLTETLSDVLKIKIYSIQIPYTWYTIDSFNQSDIFALKKSNSTNIIRIDSGNYLTDFPWNEFDLTNSNLTTNLLLNSNNIYYELTSKIYKNLVNDYDISLGDILFTKDLKTGKTVIRLKEKTMNDISDNEFIFYSLLDFSEDIITTSNLMKSNSNLGYLLGFRDIKYNYNSFIQEEWDYDSNYKYALYSESCIDLFGPRYLLLVLDDFNQNHLNKGIISILENEKNISLPEYFSNDLSYNTYKSNNNLHKFNKFKQGAPRFITQAQQHTINSIMESKRNTTNYKLKSNMNNDILAIIPIKKNESQKPGDLIVEFSGPIQLNERVYFGPVNISKLKVKLITDKGDTLNLNGSDWSFSLLSEHLYQY